MDGGDVGDSDGALGTGFGLEDMLEDTGGRPEVVLLEDVVLPFRICYRLAGSLTTHKKQGCDCLLDCDALF